MPSRWGSQTETLPRAFLPSAEESGAKPSAPFAWLPALLDTFGSQPSSADSLIEPSENPRKTPLDQGLSPHASARFLGFLPAGCASPPYRKRESPFRQPRRSKTSRPGARRRGSPPRQRRWCRWRRYHHAGDLILVAVRYVWLVIIGISAVPVVFLAWFTNPILPILFGVEGWRDRMTRLYPYRWWILLSLVVCAFSAAVYALSYA